MKLPVGRFRQAVVKLRRAKWLSHGATASAISLHERSRQLYSALRQIGATREPLRDWLVDLYWGTETTKIVTIQELRVDQNRAGDRVGYAATSRTYFKTIVQQLPINFCDYTFVDFGSGKGRAIILAARLPFQKIVGIELASFLMRIAERNIRAQVKNWRSRVQLLCVDASTFEPPTVNSVYYFFNPFGPETMKAVIKNIECALSKKHFKCFICYLKPKHSELFHDAGIFIQHSSGKVGDLDYLILTNRAQSDQS